MLVKLKNIIVIILKCKYIYIYIRWEHRLIRNERIFSFFVLLAYTTLELDLEEETLL